MGQFGTGDPLGAFSLQPMPTKTTLTENYLNFADGSGNDLHSSIYQSFTKLR